MKNLIKFEEILMFGLSIYLFSTLDFEWWWYLVLILAPDISMLGYISGSRVGAFTYNLFHHKGTALVVYLIGVAIYSQPLMLGGIILFGHASFDRIMGYGLKYSDSFSHTHLGYIGKDRHLNSDSR